MTTEEQIVAIAEACGWKYECIFPGEEGLENGLWISPNPNEEGGRLQKLPNFLNDLNAMRDAVSNLSHSLLEKYAEILQEVTLNYCVGFIPDYHRDLRMLALITNSTASQKAEAFLKTIGKWKEHDQVRDGAKCGEEPLKSI